MAASPPCPRVWARRGTATRGHKPMKVSGYSSWVERIPRSQDCEFIHSAEIYGVPSVCQASTVLGLGETRWAKQARSLLKHWLHFSQGDYTRRQAERQTVRMLCREFKSEVVPREGRDGHLDLVCWDRLSEQMTLKLRSEWKKKEVATPKWAQGRANAKIPGWEWGTDSKKGWREWERVGCAEGGTRQQRSLVDRSTLSVYV